MAKGWRKTDAAILIGLCILASICSLELLHVDGDELPSSSSSELRRYLKAKSTRQRRRRAKANSQTLKNKDIYSWGVENLKPLTETPEPSKETVLFWHIPKCGGTTAISIFQCLGQTLGNRAGALPRFGHDKDKEIIAFHPWRRNNATYVNVDTTSKVGMLRAQKLGLVPSGLADVISTSFPYFAVTHLYDNSHKGRVIVLFRHPIDRLVSKFFYLRQATWERTYSPQWNKITVFDFAQKKNNENDHMVKKLVGKTNNEKVTETDLDIAKRAVKQFFIVGLVDKMEESMRRFNIVMGIDDESDVENKKCMDQYFGVNATMKNSNPHPKVEEGSPTWHAFAEKNALDIQLYDFIVQLFEEQKEVVESYAMSIAAN